MNPAELIQRSPEWWAYRAGRATGSRIGDIITTNKNGSYSARRATYMKLLVAERLSGVPQGNGRTVRDLDARSALEPQARKAYGFYYAPVREIGFIDHPRIGFAGVSPDGLVGDVGMVEFKALDGAQHIELMETGEIDADYLAQMQFGLACSGRQWCDFGSFCPTMQEEHKLWVRRIPRDDLIIKQMETEVEKFLDEVAQRVERLRA